MSSNLRSSSATIASNSSYLLFEQAARVGLNLWTAALVARYLGPEGVGQLSYAQSIVAICLALCGLGLGEVLVKTSVEFQGATLLAQLKIAILLRVAVGFSLFVSLRILANFGVTFLGVSDVLLAWASLALIFQALGVTDSYYLSRMRSSKSVLARIISLVLVSLARVVFVKANLPLSYFAILYAVDLLIAGMVSIYFLNKESEFSGTRRLSEESSEACALRFLRLGLPLAFGAILVSLYFRLEQILITSKLGAESCGYYATAQNLVTIGGLGVAAIVSSMAPRLLKNESSDDAQVRLMRYKKVLSTLTKLSVLVAFTGSVFSHILVEQFFGTKYMVSSGILSILVWNIPMTTSAAIRAQYILAEAVTAFHLVAAGVGLLVLWIGGLVALRLSGVEGLAFASCAASFVSGILTGALSEKTRPIFILQIKAFAELVSIKEWVRFYREGIKIVSELAG